jgi:heme exporter protein B
MTSFVATEGMFEEDFEDGSLEQEFLIEKDFYKLVLSKIFVYVCLIGIPIAFIGALFSFANGVSIGSFAKVFLLLSLSNLLLFNLFAFGNALSINKGAMLGVLSSLPLALPVIILLGRAIRSIQYGDGFLTIITLMVGIGLIMSAILPLIISAALKTHID